MSAVVDTTETGQSRYEVNVEDIEYLRHGDNALLARVYRPQGAGATNAAGPFPMMIDLHGGAWCNGDRENDKVLCEALAKSGVVVAALDFRQPPEAGYPGAQQDINFAVRWIKANANTFDGDPEKVGIFGISSGGQQAMLAAMRPADPRYSAISVDDVAVSDAAVGCVVLCWPVIDPLGRYLYAKERIAADDGYPQHLPSVLPNHNKYWSSEDTMSEGSPLRILERSEDVVTPPVLYVQGEDDQMHPRAHLDRFIEPYREQGGELELALYAGEVEGFVTRTPRSMENQIDATQRIIAFVHAKLRATREP